MINFTRSMPHIIWICSCVFLVHAERLTVGNHLTPGLTSVEKAPVTWLQLTTPLPASVVVTWRAFCQTSYLPIRLQIWRELNPGKYLLVAEQRVVPKTAGVVEYDLPPRHRIPVQSGDLLGFTLEEDANPIPYLLTSSSLRETIGSLNARLDGDTPLVGNIYHFNTSHIYPREYSINVDVVRCHAPWHSMDVHCGRTVIGRETWQSASDKCEKMDGHLATPYTDDYAMALRNIMVMNGFPYMWIGVQYKNSTSQFVWKDGKESPISDQRWTDGEPSTRFACTSLSVRGDWDMKTCSFQSYFICQAKEHEQEISKKVPMFQVSIPTTTSQETHQDNDIFNPFREATSKLSNFSKEHSRKRQNVTSSDIADVSNILHNLALTSTYNETYDITDVNDYLQSVANAASIILNDNCDCKTAWSNLQQDLVEPMDVAADIDTIVTGTLKYLLNESKLISMDTKGAGLDIHLQTKQDGDFLFTEHQKRLSVSIPQNVFSGDSAAVAIITYDSLHSLTTNLTQDDRIIVSPVMAINIYPRPAFENNSEIQFSIETIKSLHGVAVPTCSFWASNGSAPGFWSSYGCRVISWTFSHTVCSCNHLTNFAVLMQRKNIPLPDHHRLALSLVTYIGCGLSICGSMATLLLHLFARCFTERAKILMNLSLALLVAHATFVTGINGIAHKNTCRITAIMLHYFFMSTFFWMLAQGIALYVKIRVIFHMPSKFIYYCILGWGLPAAIVGVSVGFRYQHYGNGAYCWLSMQTGLVWSFIGPIIVIASVNFFILCFLMKSFGQTKYKTETPGTKEHVRVRTSARAAIMLLPLLGLTWIFGLLSVNRTTIFFQYLFGICNSAQGFAIFLLHCVFNDEVRSAWRRQLIGQSPHSSTNQRTLSSVRRDDMQPKSILKRTPSNTSSSSTKSVTLRQSPESVSPDLWDVDTSGYSFSLGCLIPGRSKIVSITDPKVKLAPGKRSNRFKVTQNGADF